MHEHGQKGASLALRQCLTGLLNRFGLFTFFSVLRFQHLTAWAALNTSKASFIMPFGALATQPGRMDSRQKNNGKNGRARSRFIRTVCRSFVLFVAAPYSATSATASISYFSFLLLNFPGCPETRRALKASRLGEIESLLLPGRNTESATKHRCQGANR